MMVKPHFFFEGSNFLSVSDSVTEGSAFDPGGQYSEQVLKLSVSDAERSVPYTLP